MARVLLILLVAAAAPSTSAALLAARYRGGASAEGTPESSVIQTQAAYIERLGVFMEEFEAALGKTRTSSKDGTFSYLLGGSSLTKIQRRPDRRAFEMAYHQLWADRASNHSSKPSE